MSPDQLRETLNWAVDGVTWNVPPPEQMQTLLAAARLALSVLEQAEEMWWCEVHGSSGFAVAGGSDTCVMAHVPSGVLGHNQFEKGHFCRMVPSLRFPKSLIHHTEEAK